MANPTDRNKVLPSPFQASVIHQSFTIIKNAPTGGTSFHGYRSNFDINQQKEVYQNRISQNIHQQFNQNASDNKQRNLNIRTNNINVTSIGKQFGNWCHSCERGFKYLNQLEKHIDEHEKCWFDNCTFEGHSKLLQRHIEDQHQSSLFQRIGKVETDEDIEKWREERRKRYPTAANIEARRRAQDERMRRGERLQEPNNRFGNLSERKTAKCRIFTQKRFSSPKREPQKKKRSRRSRIKTKNVDLSADVEGSKIVQMKISAAPEKSDSNADSNALTALLGFYGSETEDDDYERETHTSNDTCISNTMNVNGPISNMMDKTGTKRHIETTLEDSGLSKLFKGDSKNISKSSTISESGADDEPPDEHPIQHNSADTQVIDQNSGPTEIIPNDKKSTKKLKITSTTTKTIFDKTRKIRKQNTLLEKLLQKEIRHERNVLLQCVRYVVDNNFFGIGKENNLN